MSLVKEVGFWLVYQRLFEKVVKIKRVGSIGMLCLSLDVSSAALT